MVSSYVKDHLRDRHAEKQDSDMKMTEWYCLITAGMYEAVCVCAEKIEESRLTCYKMDFRIGLLHLPCAPTAL